MPGDSKNIPDLNSPPCSKMTHTTPPRGGTAT